MTALDVAELLDRAADRLDQYGWWTGPGYYGPAEGPIFLFTPGSERPAWGSSHIVYAAGDDPTGEALYIAGRPIVSAALEEVATLLISRGAEPVEDRDGYVDAAGQLEAFETLAGQNRDRVAALFRDSANSIRNRTQSTSVAAEARKEAA